MVIKGKKSKKQDSKKDRLTRRQKKAQENPFNESDDLDCQLKSLGLYTKNITGDGNCLFRSLSDQYYGQDSNYQKIRREVCQYLKDNKEIYEHFVEDDQSFDHHIECMEQNATFGGNMELVAFAKLKKVNIKVYQPGMIYVIQGSDEEDDEEERQTLHIAYHSWEHYSSVRNIDGPFTGPPEVKIMGQKIGHDQENQEQEIELDSKEKVVRNACPDAKIRTIRRLLKKYKGDPNKVIDVIFASTIDNEADQMPKEIMDTTSKGKTPEEAEQEPSIPKKNLDDDNVASEETVITIDSLEDNAPSLLPEETIVKPKKKLSAAERKKEAKKRQKENKMLKDRAKAARKVSYKHEEESSSTSAVTQSMKEMHI